MIESYAAIVLAIVLFIIIIAKIVEVRWREAARIRLEAKPLMTAAERRALAMLEDALPCFRIHAQVAMGALLMPERGLSRREHWRWRGRYAQKIVDFVVEDRASGRVIALVELDDSSHDAARDARRDRLEVGRGLPYGPAQIPVAIAHRPSVQGIAADRRCANLKRHRRRASDRPVVVTCGGHRCG